MTHALASMSAVDPILPSVRRSTDLELERRAIEVTVLWEGHGGETNVLEVVHLRGPRTYDVARSILGACPMSIDVSAVGGASLELPEHATGTVSSGGETRTLADLVPRGELAGSTDGAGTRRLWLPAEARACLSIASLTFVIEPTQEGRRIGAGAWLRWDREVWMAASLAFHAAILLVFLLMPPRPPSLTPQLLRADDRPLQARLLSEEHTVETWMDEPRGGTGTRHEGASGAMGTPTHEETTRRFAIEGHASPREARLAPRGSREVTSTTGALGVLAQMSATWNVPSSPYRSEAAVGADPMSALGALMGDQTGDSFGIGGLGLRGTGRGGGGTGLGSVGLGTIGTVGHGAAGRDDLQGYGSGYGSGAGGFRGRASGTPRGCFGGCAADVRGALSREIVRRVIRRHINEVRFCYEQGLVERPDLAGRVTLTFVISGAGSVQTALIESSTIASARVESCLASAARRWTFPAPEGGGAVLVTYPFVFDSPP